MTRMTKALLLASAFSWLRCGGTAPEDAQHAPTTSSSGGSTTGGSYGPTPTTGGTLDPEPDAGPVTPCVNWDAGVVSADAGTNCCPGLATGKVLEGPNPSEFEPPHYRCWRACLSNGDCNNMNGPGSQNSCEVQPTVGDGGVCDP